MTLPPDFSIDARKAWWESAAGQYILAWEQEQSDKMVADIFGYFAMQVGAVPADFLRANRIPTRLRCDERIDNMAQMHSRPEQLGVASASIDLLVLPHVLEYSPSPHDVLREVERVLIPEGRVLFIVFNPYSIYGGCNYAHRYIKKSGHWPRGNYVGIQRLRDWCQLLNFDIQRGIFGRYLPPFAHEKWFHRLRSFEHAGHRWWPFAGSVYMLLATKRVCAVRFIVPKMRVKSRVANFSPVSHRKHSHE